MKTLLLSSLILLCTAPFVFADRHPYTAETISQTPYIASWTSKEIDKTGKLAVPQKMHIFKGDFKKFDKIPVTNYSQSLKTAIKRIQQNQHPSIHILFINIRQGTATLTSSEDWNWQQLKILRRLIEQVEQKQKWNSFSIREQIERSEVIVTGHLFTAFPCGRSSWIVTQKVYRGVPPKKPKVCLSNGKKDNSLFFLQRQSGTGPEFMVMHAVPLKDAAPYLKLLKGFKRKPTKAAQKQQQELIEAALCGDTKKVRALLKAGVDVNARYGKPAQPAKKLAGYVGYPQFTALHAAALNAQKEIMAILITAKADVNAKIDDRDGGDITPLFFTVSANQSDRKNDNDNCALQLIKAGANVNVRYSYYDFYSDSNSPLHYAVSRKRIRVVNALIAAGANVNMRSGNGQSPLHLAKGIAAAGPKIIAALLKAGANPKQPLHIENDVFIRFPKPRYQFTLAQAAKGISIPYDVIVKRDDFAFLTTCSQTLGAGTPEPSGLIPLECISGNKQFYGIILTGGSESEEPSNLTLRKGVYRSAFKWHGYNWRGEKGTPRPKRPQFPPGKYTLEVSTIGTVILNDFNIIRFRITGKTEVVITK